MANILLTGIEYINNKTAANKAKEDIINILSANNFESIKFKIKKDKLSKFLLSFELKNKMKRISKMDNIYLQYPMYSNKLEDKVLKILLKKKTKTYIIVHDLESLRQNFGNELLINRERNFFKQFYGVIAHNDKMKNWILENEFHNNVVTLELFDYLSNSIIKGSNKLDEIVFAGNLRKSTFLNKLNIDRKISLYGINPDLQKYNKNIIYKGSFSSDDLSKVMYGSFGIIWDGDSIETCSGVVGDYMRYNNPHKTSLYLSQGIPVIIWRDAALAKFIEKNQVGITVTSLNEVNSIIESMSEERYLVLKSNAESIAKKVREGFYIKHAIKKFE